MPVTLTARPMDSVPHKLYFYLDKPITTTSLSMSSVSTSKIVAATAALFTTVGTFPQPGDAWHTSLNGPLAQFIKAWVVAWLVLESVETSLVVAAGWWFLISSLQHTHDDGRVPPERGLQASEAIHGYGGVVQHR